MALCVLHNTGVYTNLGTHLSFYLKEAGQRVREFTLNDNNASCKGNILGLSWRWIQRYVYVLHFKNSIFDLIGTCNWDYFSLYKHTLGMHHTVIREHVQLHVIFTA